MSWLKVPLILIAMVGVHVTITPPHPSPTQVEKVPCSAFETLLQQRAGAMAVKTMCWLVALAESLTIISRYLPDIQPVLNVNRALTQSGCADGIHITPVFLLGAILATVGGYIRHRCYRELGAMFTFELSIRKEHRLVTTGPYRIVRHPGYTALVITMTGFICWNFTSGSWVTACGVLSTCLGKAVFLLFLTLILAILTGLLTRMAVEDRALENTFGKEWQDWAEVIPYKLVPGLV